MVCIALIVATVLSEDNAMLFDFVDAAVYDIFSGEEETVEEEPAGDEPAEESEEQEAEDVQPVEVVFDAMPDTAAVTVRPADAEEAVPAQADGSYLLLPGEYTYSAVADGFVSIEDVPFTVTGDEQPLRLSFALEPDIAEEYDAGVGTAYIQRSWDGEKVVEETKYTSEQAQSVPADGQMTSGFYYLDRDVTVDGRIELTGDTWLILGDGFTLDVKGLYIPEGSKLTIYGQGEEKGKLYSHPNGGGAAIGGYSGHDNGTIVIMGGTIVAEGDGNCAAIGSNDSRATGDITIFGGTITATGGDNGAGIGGGRKSHSGNITIYGGDITAKGGRDGAGIGCGEDGTVDKIEIYGGTVNATGGSNSAGIGGGSKLTSDSSAITLGYTDTSKETISVTASSFSGTVTLEKDFSNKSGIYSARSAADLAKLAGSALRAWDDTMETWAALSQTIDGVESGTTIVLDQDYTALPTDSALEVRGKTLTIDLNGFTLDRGLTDSAAETYGYVLSVAEGATLILKDSDGSGAITGGNTQGDGGGIVNKGTLTLENVTVTGNKCTASGGGIRNYGTGTLTINSGAITDNTAAEYSGGGIYNGGTLNLNGGAITGNFAVGTDSQGGGIVQNGTMNVSGAPVVSGNACPNGNNIYLRGDHPTMTVTGKLTDGASLYVTKAGDGTGPATSGYASFNTTHPDAYFHIDNPNYGMM